MDDITKLAFIDELDKIGFVSEYQLEAFLKEAGFLSAAGKAIKGAVGAAPKAAPKLSPQQMAAMKARWAAGAGRSGQAALKRVAPSAKMSPMLGGGSVGRGSLMPAMA